MPTYAPPVPRGRDADGHRLAVTLLDEGGPEARVREPRVQLPQVDLISSGEDHGDGAGRMDRPSMALAYGVDGLGDLLSGGQVVPDDHVVDEVCLGVAVTGLDRRSGVSGNVC